MTHALLLLQQLSYAHTLCEFQRLRERCGRASPSSSELAGICRRVKECERRWARCREGLAAADMAALRVSRALDLQMLLESADARLSSWSDASSMDRMPASHLFEWVSHDCEKLELAQLEDAMSPAEAAIYVQSLDRLQG
ncbi:hypothetical protein [Variovorax sp. DAIF25]|uniref:hypothetical protein n=1 Tax=Variovorax sp. DAIF25 TaxID=3080983 RepID=UPI003D6BADEF